MLDSLHPHTPDHLQLGEGVLLQNVNLGALAQNPTPLAARAAVMQDPTSLLGATKEGCTFRCTPDLLDLTRGQRTPAPGETQVRRWTATLTGILLELTPDNIRRLLNLPANAPLEPPATPSTPMERVCWIGSLGSGLAAIELPRPLCTTGVTLRTHPAGLGELPFTLQGQATPPDGPPCRFLWLTQAE